MPARRRSSTSTRTSRVSPRNLGDEREGAENSEGTNEALHRLWVLHALENTANSLRSLAGVAIFGRDFAMNPKTLGVWAAILVGCGGAHVQEPTTRTRTPATSEAEGPDNVATPAEVADARALPADATFGTLVERARSLDAQPAARAAEDGEPSCLLRTEPTLRFEGDVATAINPLPNPWNTFSRFQNAHGAVRVLTRWGQEGPEIYDAAIAVFTSTPPNAGNRNAVVLFLENDRVYVRLTSGAVADTHRRAVLLPALADEIRSVQVGESRAIYVTATATTTISQLRALFLAIQSLSATVALAVPLDPNAHLPAVVVNAAAAADRDVCPDGGPDWPANATEGNLSSADILGAIQNVRGDVTNCFTEHAREAAAGVRYDVSIDIAGDGTVHNACIKQESVRDLGVRTCLLNTLRAMHFPTPSPAGFVAVEFPFRFEGIASEAALPICPTH